LFDQSQTVFLPQLFRIVKSSVISVFEPRLMSSVLKVRRGKVIRTGGWEGGIHLPLVRVADEKRGKKCERLPR
jgi:hypothetical protein